MITKKHLDKLTYDVVGAAIEVHKAVSAGLSKAFITNVCNTNSH